MKGGFHKYWVCSVCSQNNMALRNRIQQSLGINIYYMPLYDLYHTVLYVGVSKNEGKSMVKQPAMKMGVSVGNGFTIPRRVGDGHSR